MNEIRPPLPTNDPFSAWATSVRDTVKAGSYSNKNNDLSINTTVNGTFLSLASSVKYVPTYTTYRGEWSPTSSYSVDDIVRVIPGNDYTSSIPWASPPVRLTGTAAAILGFNEPVLTGELNINGTSVPYVTGEFTPSPGTYICVYNVPDFNIVFAITTLMGETTVGLTADPDPLDTYSSLVQANVNYFRFSNVNYNPIYPEPKALAVFNPADISKFKGRYWECLSLAPTTMSVCENGVAKTYYVDSALSSSL
jgi:hypothetical protein